LVNVRPLAPGRNWKKEIIDPVIVRCGDI
jgi:hypothetical protein